MKEAFLPQLLVKVTPLITHDSQAMSTPVSTPVNNTPLRAASEPPFIKVHYIGHHLHVSTFCCIKQKQPREAWLNQTTGNTCTVCFGSANRVDCTFQECD